MNKQEITETILKIEIGESKEIPAPDDKTINYIRNKTHTLNREMGRRTFSFSNKGGKIVVTRNKLLDQPTLLDKIRGMSPGQVMHLEHAAYDTCRALYHEGISVRLVVEVEKL